MRMPSASSASRTSAAPAARGILRLCILVTSGPATVARIAPTRTGSAMVGRQAEQPHTRRPTSSAEPDEEPAEQPEVAEPHRRREDPRERRGVDLHDRASGRVVVGGLVPAAEPVEEPAHGAPVTGPAQKPDSGAEKVGSRVSHRSSLLGRSALKGQLSDPLAASTARLGIVLAASDCADDAARGTTPGMRPRHGS